MRNVYPANSEMELKELPACTVPHEDSDNDCMQVDEKKKKINGRKKDKKTYSENTISTVGGESVGYHWV